MSSPSRNVLIDTSTSVVSFVTENIEGCVDTLTEEFSRVGKLAVIASESEFIVGKCEPFDAARTDSSSFPPRSQPLEGSQPQNDLL